jgi:hypothetical protein
MTTTPVDWTPEQWEAVRWYSHLLRTYAKGSTDEGNRNEAEVAEGRALAAILDIAAHATPFGEDEDGFVNGGYLVSVGAIHRALGVVGHSVAPCPCASEPATS